MRKALSSLPGILVAVMLVSATAAFGQSNTTYVSGLGSDGNSCNRAHPCQTFFEAISQTAAGGEVIAVDGGGFSGSTLTITKAITIRAIGNEAGLQAQFSRGIVINAGPSDRIVLDGLDIDGLGQTGRPGTTGIDIVSAGEVFINNTHIRGFSYDGDSAGISLHAPQAVRLTIRNSTISFNTVGVAITSGANLGHAKIFGSMLLSNSAAGVRVIGAGNNVLLSGDQVLGSPKALDLQSGAQATSYNDNVITNGDAAAKVPLN
jgi:hypothetical protein